MAGLGGFGVGSHGGSFLAMKASDATHFAANFGRIRQQNPMAKQNAMAMNYGGPGAPSPT